MELIDIYNYLPFIYQCKKCYQRFPIWWVAPAEWRAGCRQGGWKRTATICKQCFEEVILDPHYFTVDEYMAVRASGSDEVLNLLADDDQSKKATLLAQRRRTREILEELWNLLPEYTPEERADILGNDSNR